jgi:uncharacterized protein (TIGR00290 family)
MTAVARPKAILAFSSGKDSAFALEVTRRAGELEIVGLVTTVASAYGRVSIHGVREALLDRQIAAIGLPCAKVSLPSPCPNVVYERAFGAALVAARTAGVTHVVFGDLFLRDVRAYREAQLAAAGLAGVFPLWGRDTRALAEEMIASGLEASLTCVDPARLDRRFAGRGFDRTLLAELPASVDPCGENGEFHTFASAGPMFRAPIAVVPGEVVERDGFVFADLLPP